MCFIAVTELAVFGVVYWSRLLRVFQHLTSFVFIFFRSEMTEKFSMDKAGDSSEDLSASGSELSDDADSFASEDEVDEDISEGSDGGQIPSSSHAWTSARKRPAPEIGLVSKKQKLNKSELYKPPTNEELNQLKETETLFRSSLFRMQVILCTMFLYKLLLSCDQAALRTLVSVHPSVCYTFFTMFLSSY